jgi:hypothetical protein
MVHPSQVVVDWSIEHVKGGVDSGYSKTGSYSRNWSGAFVPPQSASRTREL